MKKEPIRIETTSGTVWGIKMFITPKRWAYVSYQGEILTFPTEEEAEEYCKDE